MVEQLIVRIRDKTGTVREVLTRKSSRALDFNPVTFSMLGAFSHDSISWLSVDVWSTKYIFKDWLSDSDQSSEVETMQPLQPATLNIVAVLQQPLACLPSKNTFAGPPHYPREHDFYRLCSPALWSYYQLLARKPTAITTAGLSVRWTSRPRPCTSPDQTLLDKCVCHAGVRSWFRSTNRFKIMLYIFMEAVQVVPQRGSHVSFYITCSFMLQIFQ